MSEAPAEAPAEVVAGHLVIYDDTAAGRGYVLTFTADGSDKVIFPQLPPMILPLLAKVLAGDEITAADIPGGPAVRAIAGRMMPGV